MISHSFSPQLCPALLNLWHTVFTAVPIILFLLPDHCLLIVNSMFTHTHICVETEHELLMLANNTASGMSLHKLAVM
jgi:hypothetical protein